MSHPEQPRHTPPTPRHLTPWVNWRAVSRRTVDLLLALLFIAIYVFVLTRGGWP